MRGSTVLPVARPGRGVNGEAEGDKEAEESVPSDVFGVESLLAGDPPLHGNPSWLTGRKTKR